MNTNANVEGILTLVWALTGLVIFLYAFRKMDKDTLTDELIK